MDLAPVPRPKRQSLELVLRRTGLAPMRSTRTRAAAGSSRKPRCSAAATSTRGISRGFGASNRGLALRGFDRFQPASPEPWRARSDQGEVGGSLGDRRGDGLELAIAPALDPVGEQKAARVHQRHRRDRGQQRLVIRHPPALAGLEDLQRVRSGIAFRRGRGAARVESIFARRCRRSGPALASSRPRGESRAGAARPAAATRGAVGEAESRAMRPTDSDGDPSSPPSEKRRFRSPSGLGRRRSCRGRGGGSSGAVWRCLYLPVAFLPALLTFAIRRPPALVGRGGLEAAPVARGTGDRRSAGGGARRDPRPAPPWRRGGDGFLG